MLFMTKPESGEPQEVVKGPAKETVKLSTIIMAGGKGSRMKSPLPKVLHPVAGRPMIEKVIQAAKEGGSTEIRIVVGHGQNLVRLVVEPLGVHCFEQKEQLGTAHAVRSADPESLEGDVLIMNGDHPLIEGLDIRNFVRTFRDERLDLAFVSADVKNPGVLGRVVRQKGELRAIVEAKDASADTLKIKEINTGIYLVRSRILDEFLPEIKNQNSKGEYYLTDLVALCLEGRKKVQAIKSTARVAWGVNTQAELARASRYCYKKKIEKLMEDGVVVIDPRSTYVEDSVEIGAGSVIYPNTFLRGKTRLGVFCVVEPHAFISECQVGDSVQVRAGSYLEKSVIHSRCILGPYARIRPETEIMEEAQIGNFVELKKVKFGKRSKAAHLSYLGDADIGDEVNIGCGTITCNYAADKRKYQTKIGHRVFVGSDSQFVAPVQIGDDAVIGSGSTITKDVPAKALAVARSRQVIKENYQPKSAPNLVDPDQIVAENNQTKKE
jgi:bifunctional UDP-N-acetylglucosamine pyrophosphorylase/glucosamine-1-phosphate N-acetyltransferase